MKRSMPAALSMLLGLGMASTVMAWQLLPYLNDPGFISPGLAAESRESASPQTSESTPGLKTPVAPPESRYAVVSERNLFSPERAPVPEMENQAPAVPVARTEIPSLVLTGVLLAADGGVAVLQPTSGRGETLRLAVGETHQGWKLTKLTPRSATLSHDGQDLTLNLDFAARR